MGEGAGRMCSWRFINMVVTEEFGEDLDTRAGLLFERSALPIEVKTLTTNGALHVLSLIAVFGFLQQDLHLFLFLSIDREESSSFK